MQNDLTVFHEQQDVISTHHLRPDQSAGESNCSLLPPLPLTPISTVDEPIVKIRPFFQFARLPTGQRVGGKIEAPHPHGALMELPALSSKRERDTITQTPLPSRGVDPDSVTRIRPQVTLPQRATDRAGLLSWSQKVPGVTGTIKTITQKMQVVTDKLQVVWSNRTYRVEQLKVMSSFQGYVYRLLAFAWIGSNLFFWMWWLQLWRSGNVLLFLLMSVAFFYDTTVLPSFYTFYLGKMRRPKSVHVHVPTDAQIVRRVAVISLTVPGSEDLEIVKQQMIAMTRIAYPHESWILVDKCHSPEIEALARQVGVYYFSRHDVARWGTEAVSRWNQPDPPFKAKTKAGNVNSWIDAFGSRYSHFTQLDIDHTPLPTYLHTVLGYFLDPKVKWVQAPSVYGNLETWTARGSAEQEFVLQGPLQMGFYGFCQTPFIIGSHCTYDMAAIRQIGGFQPTRAEDHLDTVFLAARGYEGIFLPEVIAVGDGPENFETYLAQQFAWAYSMIQVLFTFTPKTITSYTPKQTIQFLFVQTWYVLWSLAMCVLFLLPVIALLSNSAIAEVHFGDFLLHELPVFVVALAIWGWSHVWHKPRNLGLSWRGVILHIARWPVVLSALFQVILRVQKPYMITVKGLHRGRNRPFALQSHTLYFLLMALCLGSCWFYLLVTKHSHTQGYLFFALQGALTMLLVYSTTLGMDLLDLKREGMSFFASVALRARPLCILVVCIGVCAWTICAAWTDMVAALLSR